MGEKAVETLMSMLRKDPSFRRLVIYTRQTLANDKTGYIHYFSFPANRNASDIIATENSAYSFYVHMMNKSLIV